MEISVVYNKSFIFLREKPREPCSIWCVNSDCVLVLFGVGDGGGSGIDWKS